MLVARLFSKIYKEGGIVLIDSHGQKFICGNPDLKKPLTLKILNKKLNWKLLINPDLSFPEAYVNGEIKIENGSLLDFLDLTFKNLGRGEINTSGYFIKKILHLWRFLTNYNFRYINGACGFHKPISICNFCKSSYVPSCDVICGHYRGGC